MIEILKVHSITWVFFCFLFLWLLWDLIRYIAGYRTFSQQIYGWHLKHAWIKYAYIALAVVLYFHFFTEYL